MAVRLSALRTSRALLPRNIIVLTLLVLISVRKINVICFKFIRSNLSLSSVEQAGSHVGFGELQAK
jgi:hypothetical protein